MVCSVLIVEDDSAFVSNIEAYLVRRGYEIVACHSAEEALEQMGRRDFDVVLTDNALGGMSGLELIERVQASDPAQKIIMMTGYGKIDEAVRAMQVGAFHYLAKPVVLAELCLLIDKAVKTQKIENSVSFYRARDAQEAGLNAIVGESAPMMWLKTTIRRLLDIERQMKDRSLPIVLIQGETGTGKELVARALHYDGVRSGGPFVEVNCASIPAHLMEGELFGHEKGAFTDAKDRRIGLVEAAEGGTLFLDEIGEIDLALQAKLLKLLEDRTVRRLGAVKERQIDVRIISATNCDLERLVREGKFRRDLFFRLRIIALEVPNLRQRGGDVLLLARRFLQQHGRRYGRPGLRFSPEAESLLSRYSWPGNVRELRNMLEQTVLLAPTEVIQAHQLTICNMLDDVHDDNVRREARFGELDLTTLDLPQVEHEMVIQALERTDWNVTKSARLLGLTRDMLRYRIDKLGLVRPGNRAHSMQP